MRTLERKTPLAACLPRVTLAKWSLLLLVPCLLLTATKDANAQAIGFSLSKSIFDIEVPAGGSHEDTIVIQNNFDSLITPVHVEFSMWNLKEDSDDVEFVLAEPALNATRWFTIEGGPDFILDANEEKELRFVMDVPSDTPPGSYLVSMRFQSVLPEFYFREEGPRVIPEIATLFFIRVPILSIDGTKSLYGAEIESLEPEGDSVPFAERILPRASAGVFDSAVRKLVAGVRNDGIYHFKMSGTIEIKNIFGRTLVSEPLPARILLPDRTRNIDIAVLPKPNTEDLPFFPRIFKSITYNIRTNTYFGPYRAIATLIVPENDLPVVKTANFWVIPWQFWFIVGAIVAIGLFISRRFGKDLINRIRLSVKILTNRQ